MPDSEYASFSASSKDAEDRFLKFGKIDPFQQISPGLLNSADIADYVRMTGMIFPFDENSLKPATYGLKLGGKVVYWTSEGKKIVKNIDKKKKFTLKSNSIAFVSLAEELRLPDYMIARFNLKISNIYKGVLLGTGPLVDPGFKGILSLPLHNLTNNDYEYEVDETLIWMEFTKITQNEIWCKGPDVENGIEFERLGKYVFNKLSEKGRSNRDVEDYLIQANPHGSIESSLPKLQLETQTAVKKAESATEKAEKIAARSDATLSRYNIGIVFSFVAMLGMICTIVSIFKSDLKEIRDKKWEDRIKALEQQRAVDSTMLRELRIKISKENAN